MKYFKPELLTRCRSLDDDVAEVAADEWEQAVTDYRARIRAIRLRLPLSVRRLRTRVSLHDAKVLAITFGSKQPRVTLLLRLEDTPVQSGDVLELHYLSMAGPQGGATFSKRAQLNPNGTSEARWILYDEWDRDEGRACFTHTLLLTDGYEVEVRFHDLRVRRLQEVLVSPLELTEVERTWPLLET